MRYFSLKPRLKILFTYSKIAKYMRCRVEDDNKDGTL